MGGLSGGGHNMLVMELIDKLLEVDGDLVVTYDADGRIVRATGIGRC